MNLITALWLGALGACIGSFLNVVAYRLPLGMSVIWKPSHCPKCGHAIRAYDNVPIFGWLWLRGHCRDCGEPISPRYAVVEFLMGTAFFLLAYVELFRAGGNLPNGPISEFVGAMNIVWIPYWPLIGLFAYHALLISLLMCVTLIELDGQKVPNGLIGFGLVAGIGLALWFPFMQPTLPLIPEDGPTFCNGFLGAALGVGLGIVGSRLLSALSHRALVARGHNLTVGLVFLGAFLGWQGVISMVIVLLFAGLNALLHKSNENLNATISIWLVALIQLTFWKPLADVVFSFAS